MSSETQTVPGSGGGLQRSLSSVAALALRAFQAETAEIVIDGGIRVTAGCDSGVLSVWPGLETAWVGDATDTGSAVRTTGRVAFAPLTAPDGQRGWFAASLGDPPPQTVATIESLEVMVKLVEGILDREAEQYHLDELGDELRATQRNLASAQQELAASNERLDQFATVAAHELAAPLRSLGVYADLLALNISERRDDGVLAECADQLQRGIRTMSEDVAYLLALARVDGDRGPIERVDLTSVAESAIATMQPALADVGAATTVGDLPLVAGRWAPLRAVFINLLSNAIRYRHPDRSLAIAISARRVATGWEVLFVDNGLGFGHASAQPDADGSGLGIGLDLSRRIVADCGGSLRHDEAAQMGAALVVSLAAAPEPESPSGFAVDDGSHE